MDLAEWRRARAGADFTLPSGLAVRLRRCQLLDLAEQGRIPTPLVGLANALLASDSLALTVEDYRQYAPVINAIAAACLVSPEGDGAPFEIEELPAADRLAIYNWANDITVAVQPFRDQRSGDGAAGPGQRSVRSKTQRRARDPG